MAKIQCKACLHPEAPSINRRLVEGATLKAVLTEYQGISLQDLDRHRRRCLGMQNQARSRPTRLPNYQTGNKVTQSSRPTGDRCGRCGVSTEEVTPQSLLKRAERFLYFAEASVFKHSDDENSGQLLASLDRANSAMKLLMQAVGMIGDKGTVINITDQRQQAYVNLAKLSDETLRALNSGDRAAWTALERALDTKALTDGNGAA